MIATIVNHTSQAISRLITQYGNQPNLQGLVGALISPVQAIEDALNQLNMFRLIDQATGVQLDGLGKIVGIARFGLSDNDYRFWIKAAVLINISDGEPETVLAIYNLLTETTSGMIFEYYPASVGLSSDGLISAGNEDLVAGLVLSALPAGVRLDSLGYYDSSNPFSFDGTVSPQGAGFGSIYDSTLGGIWGGYYAFGAQFGFQGTDQTEAGFGSIYDPALGGKLAS
jgi:hypothetical protein